MGFNDTPLTRRFVIPRTVQYRAAFYFFLILAIATESDCDGGNAINGIFQYASSRVNNPGTLPLSSRAKKKKLPKKNRRGSSAQCTALVWTPIPTFWSLWYNLPSVWLTRPSKEPSRLSQSRLTPHSSQAMRDQNPARRKPPSTRSMQETRTQKKKKKKNKKKNPSTVHAKTQWEGGYRQQRPQ